MCDLIVIEGANFSGKTTVANKLFEIFKKEGKEAILTKEPGGTQLGTEIRKYILNGKYPLTQQEILLGMMFDKAMHINSFILPYMRENKTIICDRFMKSTYVYQHEIGKIDLDYIKQMYSFIIGDYKDFLDKHIYTFVLDVDYEHIQQRFDKENININRFKNNIKDEIEYYKKIHTPDEIHINGNQPVSKIITDILNHLPNC